MRPQHRPGPKGRTDIGVRMGRGHGTEVRRPTRQAPWACGDGVGTDMVPSDGLTGEGPGPEERQVGGGRRVKAGRRS